MTEDSMVQEVFEQLKKAEQQTHDYWKNALWLADSMTIQFDWIRGSTSNSLLVNLDGLKTVLLDFH